MALKQTLTDIKTQLDNILSEANTVTGQADSTINEAFATLCEGYGQGGVSDAYAVISVTYPTGSVCTCSNGVKTLRAKDTSGQWLFVLPSGGEWTITLTDGEKTAIKTIFAEQNKTYEIDIVYKLALFDNGDLGASGGWTGYAYGQSGNTITRAKPTVTTDTSITASLTGVERVGSVFAENLIDFSQYKTVFCTLEATGITVDGLSVSIVTDKTNNFNRAASVQFPKGSYSSQAETLSLDIPEDISSGYVMLYMYVGAGASHTLKASIKKCWME